MGIVLHIDNSVDDGPPPILQEFNNVLNTQIAPFLLGCTNGPPTRQLLRRQLQMTVLTNLIFQGPTFDADGT